MPSKRTVRVCPSCGRNSTTRLAKGLCSWCYQQANADHNPVDQNALAFTTTRPELADADHTWWDQARCRGTPVDVFFPAHNTRPAKEICQGCPIRARCLDYAMTNGIEFGVWGGTSEKERRALRRLRRQRIEAA